MPRRSASSQEWLRERRRDPYVQAAARDGYRSRAAYKLLEIQASMRPPLIGPGMGVVDLGAAPGGWTQVVAPLVGKAGRVVAVDLLPMAPVAATVTVMQGDFLDQDTLERIVTLLDGGADLVLSDLAPNMSGIAVADQARGELLAENACQFAARVLRPGGSLVVKLFQGPGFHTLVREAKTGFGRTKVVKPKASRGRSPEQYLVCQAFKG
ncbi:MAG: RlmE family RNA methyltransferase [Magnetococcales bacterium]|nr:RlmE family RNA methyltransferase [Magnetococcales bacterium]